MSGVAEGLAAVRARIARACEKAGRDPQSVRLVAVSKLQPVEKLREALAVGHRDFGENYAQELRDKAEALAAEGPQWHFIGALQTNKVKYVLGRTALLHTCDRAALVEELQRRAVRLGIVQRILVEVNLGGEEQKGGARPGDIGAVLDAIHAAPALRCEGLMCIPPAEDDPRPHFRRLRALRDELQQARGIPLPELSMGMSADFEMAIEEGATVVRVGTAIFGERPQA